jgi:ribosomal protein S18 acetylase RimI-like enzyme
LQESPTCYTLNIIIDLNKDIIVCYIDNQKIKRIILLIALFFFILKKTTICDDCFNFLPTAYIYDLSTLTEDNLPQLVKTLNLECFSFKNNFENYISFASKGPSMKKYLMTLEYKFQILGIMTFLIYKKAPENECYIERLEIKKEYRRKGIGLDMIKKLEDLYFGYNPPERSNKKIVLESSENAIGFYKKQGYVETNPLSFEKKKSYYFNEKVKTFFALFSFPI